MHDWTPTCAKCGSVALVMDVTLFNEFGSYMRARCRVACHGMEEEFEIGFALSEKGISLPTKVFDLSPSGLREKHFISHTVVARHAHLDVPAYAMPRLNPSEIKSVVASIRKHIGNSPHRKRTPRRKLPEVHHRPQRLITLEE